MSKMDTTTLPGGPGGGEEQMHPATGLRNIPFSGVFASSDKCIASSQALANSTAWTVLPLSTSTTNPLNAGQYSEWGADQHTGLITGAPEVYRPLRNRLPFPCTPCITYRQTHATPANNQVFSIRVQGFDQFGTYQVEELENISVLPASEPAPGTPSSFYKRKTRLWLSKVFSLITRVEYKLANAQGTSDFIDVGCHWDFDFSGNRAPYETYIAQANQGVGTPYRINPAASGLSLVPPGVGPGIYAPELVGLSLTQLDGQQAPIMEFEVGTAGFTLATALTYTISAITVANPTAITLGAAHGYATGQRFLVRIAIAPIDALSDISPSIDGEWVATATGATTFTIPVNVTAAPTGDLIAYIPGFVAPNNDDVPVLISGVGGPADPASINGLHYVRMSDRVTGEMAIAAVAGTGGVAQLFYAPTAHVQPYDATWSGGTDQPARGGFVLGQQLAGYEGTPHKWAIKKSYTNGVTLNGDALLEASFGVDAAGIRQHFPWRRGSRVAFQAWFRTMLGTSRNPRSGNTYPR